MTTSFTDILFTCFLAWNTIMFSEIGLLYLFICKKNLLWNSLHISRPDNACCFLCQDLEQTHQGTKSHLLAHLNLVPTQLPCYIMSTTSLGSQRLSFVRLQLRCNFPYKTRFYFLFQFVKFCLKFIFVVSVCCCHIALRHMAVTYPLNPF